jgi:hypothetical protein
MGLSNAERQRRYIRRLKAAAAKVGLTAKLQARIRELEMANADLRRKSAVLNRWLQNRKRMPDATYRAVVKCLHPDMRRGMTPKQIDEACGLFTQWKKAQDR